MKQSHDIRLRQEREQRGWSRAYVAQQVGVDVATVGRWERGERLPHPHYRQKLCVLYKKNAQELGLITNSADAEKEDDTTIAPDLQALSPSTQEPVEPFVLSPRSFFEESGLATNQTLTRMELQMRRRMLRKIYTFWINGVLEQSLHGATLIPLDFEERPGLVTDPWALTMQQPEMVPPLLIQSGMHISEIYDRADGELLIVGEPGSGKTTLLLELARVLLNRAMEEDTHPIPVVFNLASWSIKRQPLDSWLVDELGCKYLVPHKLASAWVWTEQVLPLLDGLDEVTPVHRSACIEAINAYRRNHGLLSMVVCSRLADYSAQSARLLLRCGVIIQDMHCEQIKAYLSSQDEEFSVLHETLKMDSTLQELARNPLMLSILVQTYQNQTITMPTEPSTLEVQRQKVLAMYVQCMLSSRKSRYTPEQTLRWLTWLAEQLADTQQTEFHIEEIQPAWLKHPRALRWYDRLLTGVLMGFLGGCTGMLADIPLYEVIHRQIVVFLTNTPLSNVECAETLPPFDTVAESIASLFALPIVGLFFGIGFALLGCLLGGLLMRKDSQPQNQSAVQQTPDRGFSRRLLFVLLGLGCGSVFMLINLLWVPCQIPPGFYDQTAEELSYGLAGILIGGLVGGLADNLFGVSRDHIQPAKILSWAPFSGRKHILALLSGIALGALVGGGTWLAIEVYLGFALWQNNLMSSLSLGGLLGAIVGGWFGGFSRHTLATSDLARPNEGIRRSAVNGLIIGLPIGLSLSGFALELALWLLPSHLADGLLWSIPLGLVVAVFLFLLNGGYAYVQHMVLRFLLYYQGHIPWNYARFLDDAAERLLLRKVGGGYTFIHRSLLEYFHTVRKKNEA